ncbi:MAG: hypothetical protein ACE5KT_11465 [Methanosarcinales archaeon]
MALKIIEIELFSNIDKRFRIIEAIVDTGASQCTISTKVAREFGIDIKEDVIHHWQANCPLTGRSTNIKIRYNDRNYELEASCIEIDEKYFRPLKFGEECTRPKYSHPLAYRIILGLNFIELLSDKEKHELIGYILLGS